MIQLTKAALRRPVSVFIIVLALIIFGGSSVLSTPLELIPNIEMPMLTVITTYAGAAPQDVERLVTSPIEDAVSTITGVKNVQSSSMENFSLVMIELEYGTNMDEAHSDLNNNIDMMKSTLPEDASEPTVVEINMNTMMPTIVLSATSSGDVDLLNYLEEEISPEFEKLNGIASVDVTGGRESYVRVELREEKLSQYGLTMSSLVNVISNADFSLPAGSIAQGDLDLTLRGGVSYPTIQSLRSIPITLSSGDVISLADVADIYETTGEVSSLSRYNGEENVNVSIIKRQSASTLSVTRAAKQVVEQLNAENTGIELGIVYDSSEMILDSLNTLLQTLLGGVLLSMIVLFFFFGEWRASLIVGSSIPLSLLVTLIAMSGMGFTFNMLSVGGLVIGVGMMVDNSIVVLESCFRCKEEQRSFYDAALEGSRLVVSSVLGSTLTTVVVFLPMALIEGMSGQLFGQLCFTIVFSLIASLISAVTLVPLMFSRTEPVAREKTLAARMMSRLERGYAKLLPKFLSRKRMVIFVSVLLLVGSFALVPFLGFELMPATDEGTVTIDVTTRPGLQLEKLDEKLLRLEGMVASHEDVDRYSLSAGGSGMAAMMGGASSSATLTVYLKSDRVSDTAEIIDLWRNETADMIDCDVSISSSSTTSMMFGGSDITVSLQATDYDALEEGARQIEEMMRQNPHILRVSSSISAGNPQAEIVIDPVKAAAVGMVPAQIMGTVYQTMQGTEATTLSQNGQDYSIRVEYPDGRFASVADLAGMTVMSPMGYAVPLLDIATIEYSDSPQSIAAKNGRYILTVTGQAKSSAPQELASQIDAQARAMLLPDGVEVTRSEVTEQMIEEFSSLLSAILTAAFLVFMVMAMQFESVQFSLVVMICIPFALIGSFLSLFLTGVTISMISLMGILMLIGIVVNNGILFIDTANLLRKERGLAPEEALVRSGTLRMRPILMTTLTTVLAQLPMAVTTTGNAALMNGMALVIIGGLVASTLLTLLLLPAFYLVVDEKSQKRREKKYAKRQKRLAALSRTSS